MISRVRSRLRTSSWSRSKASSIRHVYPSPRLCPLILLEIMDVSPHPSMIIVGQWTFAKHCRPFSAAWPRCHVSSAVFAAFFNEQRKQDVLSPRISRTPSRGIPRGHNADFIPCVMIQARRSPVQCSTGARMKSKTRSVKNASRYALPRLIYRVCGATDAKPAHLFVSTRMFDAATIIQLPESMTLFVRAWINGHRNVGRWINLINVAVHGRVKSASRSELE